MVFDVTNCVLTPYERVIIIGLELFGNKLCPGLECSQLFLAKHVWQVTLNRKHRCSPDPVANNYKQPNCLIQRIRQSGHRARGVGTYRVDKGIVAP